MSSLLFRPRCIGFARRRMGRGGRVLLDRVASNFDDFWSQLDYTILESKTTDSTAVSAVDSSTTTTKNNDSTAKPASPPTVVDLVPSTTVSASAATVGTLTSATTTTTVHNTNIPAITIKEEVIETNRLLSPDTGVVGEEDKLDVGLNGCCEYEYSDDDEELEDEHGLHIQRDRIYHSCISMARRRRRRRRHQQQQNETNSKRRKLNNVHMQQKTIDAEQRRWLYKLSQSLLMDNSTTGSCDDMGVNDGGVNGRVNNLINSAISNIVTPPTTSDSINSIKQEKVNGLNKSDVDHVLKNSSLATSSWSNHKIHTSSSSSLPSAASTLGGMGIGINNNNNSSNNVNMNISNGSRSNSCSISDKMNVIKAEIAVQDADLENASTPSCAPGEFPSRVIKQEMIDSSAPSIASADDSNEPLSSIQKLNSSSTAVAAAADIVEDEENVNLAQLSNLIKIKKEVVFEDSNDRGDLWPPRNTGMKLQSSYLQDSEDEEVSCLNQMADVIRQRDLSRRTRSLAGSDALKGVNILIEEVANVNDDEELTMLGGLSPTSSQRLDVCNELLSEIRRDWLHFRPKTPTETEKDDFWSLDMDYKLSSSPLVDWTQQTPIAVEMVRETLTDEDKLLKKESPLWIDPECKNSAFITPAFKYEDLEADTQFLQNSFMSDITRGSSKSPDGANNSACLDLNFSGDSLNDINLLGDGDDADMLDNILQEVQIDDIKTLATNFWNGILDGENVDAEVDGDVEAAAGLLDGIDDATKKCDKSLGGGGKKSTKAKGGKKSCAALLAPVGSSSFNCSPLETATVKNETFFKSEDPKKEPPEDDEQETVAEQDNDVAVKLESMEVTEVKPADTDSNQHNMIVSIAPQQQLQQQQLVPITTSLVMPSSSSTAIGRVNLEFGQRTIMQDTTTAPIAIATQPLAQQQQQQQQQHHHQLQPQQHHQHLITHSTPLQVIGSGNAIAINSAESISAPQNQMQTSASIPANTQLQQQTSQQQQQQQLTTIQVLQQPATQQIRNVTVQQLHQLQLQQQQQRKLQLQQHQQQKLLMQRQGELVNTSSNSGGGASVITQYIPTTSNASSNTTIMRQATLTPIGASTVTNSSGQMIYTTTSAADVIGTTGSQKIYLQKAPVSLASTTQGVNIINTSSGQQLTVQNIAGVQHINATGNGSNATAGPLIVTTSARNAVQQLTQQQQQQLVGQSTQQIVWRQIGSTNVTTTPSGILAGTTTTSGDGTVTATTGAGNKIVWTNRTAQKRQSNGSENTGKSIYFEIQISRNGRNCNIVWTINSLQELFVCSVVLLLQHNCSFIS